MTKQKNKVPSLRFREFYALWKYTQLGNIASFSKGKGVSKADIDENGLIFCIRYGELYTYYSELIDNVLSKTNVPKSELLLSKAGDVIMPASGESKIDIATASCVLSDGIALGGDLNIIRSELNGLFLSYYLNNARKNAIARLAQGISVVHLYSSQLKGLNINYPSEEEQQKISDFLSSVDERIRLLEQKKEKLQAYKKGVMQKIFSQQIRFKDENGNDFPEWEEKTLGDIADKKVKWSFTGGPFGSDLKTDSYTESGVQIIQLQNIGDGLFMNDNVIYTSEEKADQLISCNIYPNEIIISKMGDPVARACIIPEEQPRYLMASDGIRLVPNTKEFDIYFIFLSINYIDFRKKANAVSTGSTRKRIGLSELRQLALKIPQTKEQQKIAEFISTINKSVDLVTRQIQKTQTFKKGLLQKMFV